MCDPASNVQREKGKRDGDIDGDGWMTTEDCESRGIGFMVGLCWLRFIGARNEEFEELHLKSPSKQNIHGRVVKTQ
jgi:hypothetical protein